MKKILLLILSVAMLCVGCSESETETEKVSATQAKETFTTESTTSVQTTISDQENYENDYTATMPSLSAENATLVDSFQPLCQYPELPTGCEMTSLTMVLNYYGVTADKCDISDNYLDKGTVGTVDFNVAFVGDPRDESSYGCYAPVVVNTANRYLEANQSPLRAKNLTNTELEELFTYIDANVPVIVWGTQNCQEGHYSVTWNVDGQDLTWFTPEHCMVLVGYDENNVWIADPIYGNTVSYDRDTFRNCYDSLYKQAVVIE